MSTKRCYACGKHKPLDAFHMDNTSNAWHKRQGCCKTCRSAAYQKEYAKPEFAAAIREQHLKRKYGITLEDYDKLFAAQDGMCALCGTDEPGGRFGVFNVDHCHVSGRVRGLLCWPCNRSLEGYEVFRAHPHVEAYLIGEPL